MAAIFAPPDAFGTADRTDARADPVRRSAVSSGYIPTLDGWRALAVALVLVCHVVGPASVWRDASGALGVSIFFGISGYLICTRLLEEQRSAGQISLKMFYLRRAFRILPPAFAYLGFVAILGVVGTLKVSKLEIVSGAFFFRNYAPGNWFTSHFWSLAVEEHFYLFFPALLVLAGTKRMVWIALAISLVTAVWRIVDTRVGLLTSHLPDGVYAAARTDFRLDGLMLGCLAALILFRKPLQGRVPPMVLALGTPACAAILVANMLDLVHLPEIARAAVIVVMLVSSVTSAQTPIGRFLEFSALRWVGRLSYSLYLWQQLFFVKFEGNHVKAFDGLQRFPYNLCMVIAAAATSYYCLERPLIKVGQRLAKSLKRGRTLQVVEPVVLR